MKKGSFFAALLIALAASAAQAEYVPMRLSGAIEEPREEPTTTYREPTFAHTVQPRQNYAYKPYFSYSQPFFRPTRLESLGARTSYGSSDSWRGKRYGYNTYYRNPYRWR